MSDQGLVTWRPRLTVRLRLTLSYAGLLVVAGGVMRVHLYGGHAVRAELPVHRRQPARRAGRSPTRGEILDLMVKLSAYAIGLLAIIGMVGGWFFAGRMLQPLQEITAAARRAATGRSITGLD